MSTLTTTSGYRSLSGFARASSAAAAVVACGAGLAAVLGLFDSAGSTPWFTPQQAALVAHCEPVQAPTQRHACLQAAAQERPAPTRVALRAK